jgi:hypothetical protein
MTILINAITTSSLDDIVLVSTLNLIVILNCLIVLIIRAFVGVAEGERAARQIQILNVVTYPLIVLCVIVIILRFNLMIALNMHTGP